jgi:NAD(P)-dependent dehydrogenase (short-subunit alcohol dehydrogenase family)
MKLAGKIALITGSTKHTGFGIARKFLDEGATVVINGRQEKDVQEAAEKLRQSKKGSIWMAAGDVGKAEDVEKIFSFISEKLGTLHIMVNNAVLQGVGDDFLKTPATFWDEMLAVNIKGLFLCSQKAAQMMVRQGGGVIINLGSTTAYQALRGRSTYIATKGAIDSVTRALALDLAPHHIRVNCLIPGYIRTTRWDSLPKAVIDKRRSNIPLKVEVTYEDVANAAVFLACDDSKNMTGSRLIVDGGCLAQLLPDHAEA